MNKEKGCVKPADGTPKKCVINVVKCKESDVTRRHNSIVYNNSPSILDNSELLKGITNWKNWIVPFVILLILNIFLVKRG